MHLYYAELRMVAMQGVSLNQQYTLMHPCDPDRVVFVSGGVLDIDIRSAYIFLAHTNLRLNHEEEHLHYGKILERTHQENMRPPDLKPVALTLP